MATTLSRTNLNALVEDDGSFLTGTILDKETIEDVCLDPVDAAIAADIQFGGSIKERGRSLALGEWENVPFDAGNFAGVAPLTVTVSAGQVAVNRSMRIGKTIFWTLQLASFTLGGSAGPTFRCTVPYGATIAGGGFFALATLYDGAGAQSGRATFQAGTTYMAIDLATGGNLTPGATFVYFSGFFEAA